MALKEDIQAAIAEITSAADNIAADLDRIAEQVSGGLTEAEATEVQGQLSALATKMRGLADRNPEPEA